MHRPGDDPGRELAETTQCSGAMNLSGATLHSTHHLPVADALESRGFCSFDPTTIDPQLAQSALSRPTTARSALTSLRADQFQQYYARSGDLADANSRLIESLLTTVVNWRHRQEGLGYGTSHREDHAMGWRLVCAPLELPSFIHDPLHRTTQLFVEALAEEPDEETIRRVNRTFEVTLAEAGVSDPELFRPEVVLAVKEAAVRLGHISMYGDFVPVPVKVRNGRLIPDPIPDASNTWRENAEAIIHGERQVAFMMMEIQGSYAGYMGFAHRYMRNGAFNGTSEFGNFVPQVQDRIFGGASDFTVVDYKVVERDGERHHALDDKVDTGYIWGAGRQPVDTRELLQKIESGELDGVRLMNTTTSRELGLVMRGMSEPERERFKALLNDTSLWVEHPAAFALVNKGSMVDLYERYGPSLPIIPSFRTVDDLEQRLHYRPEYVISKCTGGDTGYGTVIGTLEEVRAKTSGEPNRVVQPLVDLLRIAPNELDQGPLAKGGMLELRVTNLPDYGLTRIGAHEPYDPVRGTMTMSHQDYIMEGFQRMVRTFEADIGLSHEQAWTTALLLSNAGFGVFKVRN